MQRWHSARPLDLVFITYPKQNPASAPYELWDRFKPRIKPVMNTATKKRLTASLIHMPAGYQSCG
jgi:hypothetical protein